MDQREDKFVACRLKLIIRIFRRSNLMSIEPDRRVYKKLQEILVLEVILRKDKIARENPSHFCGRF